MNTLTSTLESLTEQLESLASSLERDIPLSREREQHVRVTARANQARAIASSAQSLLESAKAPRDGQTGISAA